MDYIPLIKSKKNAMRDCINSPQLTPQKQQQLQQHLKILQYSPWITKGTILLGIVFGVNWKLPKPLSKRQLPLAVAAIALSAISDYAAVDYVWNHHETDIVKLTGFKNGIYVSPERMAAMRSSVILRSTQQEEDFIIQDD